MEHPLLVLWILGSNPAPTLQNVYTWYAIKFLVILAAGAPLTSNALEVRHWNVEKIKWFVSSMMHLGCCVTWSHMIPYFSCSCFKIYEEWFPTEIKNSCAIDRISVYIFHMPLIILFIEHSKVPPALKCESRNLHKTTMSSVTFFHSSAYYRSTKWF